MLNSSNYDQVLKGQNRRIQIIGHFRVLLCLCFKTSLSANLSYENEFCIQFHFHANQSYFHNNGFALKLALKQRQRELGNGLFLQKFKEAHAAYHSHLRDENEFKHDFKSVLCTLESLFTTFVLFHAVTALCKFRYATFGINVIGHDGFLSVKLHHLRARYFPIAIVSKILFPQLLPS